MSYIDSSLGQNEVLHYRARFHWLYRASAWGALILGVFFAALTLRAGNNAVALLPLAVGGLIWLAIQLPISTTEIGVTNQRIIYKRGFIQRGTNELQLRSIEEVRFIQDFWGRIFDFGRLEIHGTGDDAINLPSTADPLGFRAALQEAIGAVQQAAEPPASDLPPSPQEEPHARSA